MTGGAVTAGTTFGIFRGLGNVAIHSSEDRYQDQVSATLRATVLGGALGGAGNMLAAAILTPAAIALMTQLMGNKHDIGTPH